MNPTEGWSAADPSPAGSPTPSTAGSDPAVDVVLRLIADPEHVSPADLTVLLDTVRRYLHRSSPWLDADQGEDVAMSAILRLLEAARAEQVDTSRNVLGYLLRIARHAAATAARTGEHRHTSPADLSDLGTWQIPSDDNVARHLNAHADAQIVRAALAAAYHDGDTTTVKVVSYVLDILQEQGRMPSQRTIAVQVGLSHTGVAKALTRFTEIVTSLGGNPS